ncbi:MAG: UbiA family prenyltransferase [Phycisphaerales bacterium]|nr:UbiA family prenyltransferase [Phycisphaerales bacterium]
MRLLSSILNWILYSSVFAGFCALGLSMATESLLLATNPDGNPGRLVWLTPLHLFVFANTLLIYNVHYGIKRLPAGASDRADWSARHRSVHPWLIGLSAIASGVCLLFLNREVLLASLLLGVLSLAYSLPILPFIEKKRLKDFGLLKLLLLCFVWASVTTWLPTLQWGKKFNHYEVEFLLRFTLMMPLCIAFDIRDMRIDRQNRIFTLPNVIGLPNAYRLINLSLLALIALAIWQYARYPILHRLIGAFAIALLIKVIIHYSRKYNSDRYHLLAIDGVMILYALLIIVPQVK